MSRDPYVDAANALAHAHQRRYDEPVTPGEYWASWSWLERLIVVATGTTLGIGGWILLGLGLLAGSGS